jgi:hypothetical protein
MAPFILLLAFAAQAATQPDWRPLGVSNNGRPAFYDPASVVRAGDVTRVRLRFTDENHYALSTTELRCAAFAARMIGVITYAADGTEVNRNEMVTPFRGIAMGGFLDTLARAVCDPAILPPAPQ